MVNGGRAECSRKFSKCGDKKGELIDRTSILADELLVLILSFLPVKEAVATSILSRRWRYLWTFISRLDFDGTSSMVKIIGERGFLVDQAWVDKRRFDYVGWVNHVIALHKRPNIEEFRVFFDLTKSFKNSIDEWLRFALSRKVERLELNLRGEASRRPYRFSYALDPYNILGVYGGSFSDSIEHVKYLKKVSLDEVYVNNEALTFFLCNCPLLEHLSVSKSKGLSTLRIIGPLPPLKHLEITLCHNLNSIEIRDVNLVYLKYVGGRVNFVVENLPQLVEMFVGGEKWDIRHALVVFSNYTPQLEILTLHFFDAYSYHIFKYLPSGVKMSNLKQFIVKTCIDYDDTLIPLTNLVYGSPCLQRFVLEATHGIPRYYGMPQFMESESMKTVRSYPQLKEIQLVGYRGVVSELELFTHFLENCVTLEKILVDTRTPVQSWEYLEKIYYATLKKNRVSENELRAKSRAKEELPMKVSPKINLEIL